MWQKSEYFCLNSLNQLLKIIDEVDDLSNSDKVKSTVTGLEFQIGTSGILLIAISSTSIFAFFNSFLQCIPKESVADSAPLEAGTFAGTAVIKFEPHGYTGPVLDWTHDDVIKWKYFLRHWPFVREIHRSPVNSHHKGQWRQLWWFICA